MSNNRQFVRKITYAGVGVALLLPLAWISMPASGQSGSEGGKLAQMRTERKLGQNDLGEIDPTSEVIKLSTLGMRGVAAQIYWSKANEYKKKENWTAYRATLDQITKVMPNFVAVWRHQAWNLSYNISVEFDDYRHRYFWVMEGIKYLKEGRKFNQHDPRILSDIGWFTGYKIGRADEKDWYRKMYRLDRQAAGYEREEDVDNWLVGKKWLLESQNLVDNENVKLLQMSSVIFHSHPSMWQIHYCRALQDDGILLPEIDLPQSQKDEIVRRNVDRWRRGWRQAVLDWSDDPKQRNSYGDRDLNVGQGHLVRLNDFEPLVKRFLQLQRDLRALQPGLAETILKERIESLSPESKVQYEPTLKALNKPKAARSESDQELIDRGIVSQVRLDALILRMDEKWQSDGKSLAEEIREAGDRVKLIGTVRDTVSFDYWQLRCRYETDELALSAWEKYNLARQARARANLPLAKRRYLESFDLWEKLLKKMPEMRNNEEVGRDLMDLVEKYSELLVDYMDEVMPGDFVLRDIVEEFGEFEQ